MHIHSSLFLILLGACGSGSDKDSGNAGEFSDDPSDNNGQDLTEPPPALPTISGEGEDPGGCEDLSGTAIPGAASMFYGVYWERGDGQWAGEEQWQIFSNAAWREVGGEDCVVVWAATASQTAAPSCPGCDIGLSVSIELDEAATSCDPELVSGLGNTETYGIARGSGTDATWYFANSGDRLGDGHHVDGGMNFLTDPSCRWW